MKFERFWKLVDEHPWLPRILGGFWEAIQGIHVDPKFIATFFAPSVIEKEVSFICFQPWERLDLNSMVESKDVERSGTNKGEAKTSDLVGKKIYYICYWHKSGSPKFDHPFSGETSNYHEINVSVREMIARVRKEGCTLDAVVQIHEFVYYKTASDQTPPSSIDSFDDLPGEVSYVSSGYAIFLVPSKNNRISPIVEDDI